jgi:hypothetical protein
VSLRVKDWVMFNDGDGPPRTCQVVAVNQHKVWLELFPAGKRPAVRLWVAAKSPRIQPIEKAKVA